ncbi:RNA ligase [Lignipirellula cremea]|uniref:RNA ligase n=2 Tax=Lignipirellula cremea TaxID=2528010 RepID=A0A518E1H2_9BACT|nr:RNA ligase [Lignipirellula cremea]
MAWESSVSSLIVEVCQISKVAPHPQADRMAIAHIKGWQVCIGKNADTGRTEFQPGDKVVYFPPETVIPHTLSDQMGVTKFLTPLPPDVNGQRPQAGRIRVARLRGEPSYGLLRSPDVADWNVGDNVADYYGARKYEPPESQHHGDSEPSHPAFPRYYDMENLRNFPDLFQPGDPVVVTEKIHGTNVRLGLIRVADDQGVLRWRWTAGSHDVRRQEYSTRTQRFDLYKLVEQWILQEPAVVRGQILDTRNGQFWRVEESLLAVDVSASDKEPRVLATQVDASGEEIRVRSNYWTPFSPQVKALLAHVSGCGVEDPDGMRVGDGPTHDVVLFGEMFGAGIQQGYWYGCANGQTSFRAFDLLVDLKYLDFAARQELCERFQTPLVPVLYQGPYDRETIEQLASGPSAVAVGATQQDDSVRIGREGVVVSSVEEEVVVTPEKIHDRKQLKCINFAYLARKGGTEFH